MTDLWTTSFSNLQIIISPKFPRQFDKSLLNKSQEFFKGKNLLTSSLCVNIYMIKEQYLHDEKTLCMGFYLYAIYQRSNPMIQ